LAPYREIFQRFPYRHFLFCAPSCSRLPGGGLGNVLCAPTWRNIHPRNDTPLLLLRWRMGKGFEREKA